MLITLEWGLVMAGCLGVAAVMWGLRLPKTHVAASEAFFPVTADELWHILVDRASFPTWRPGLANVEVGMFEGRPGWTEICVRNTRVRFVEVARVEPSKLVTCLEPDGRAITAEWTFDLRPGTDGTTLTITATETVHHPLLRLFCRYVLSYHGTMDVYLIALGNYWETPTVPKHLSMPIALAHSDDHTASD